MRKFDKVEKVLIAMTDGNYNTYDCPEHGVFSNRKDIDDSKCLYCKEIAPKLENVEELKEKFKKELKISNNGN